MKKCPAQQMETSGLPRRKHQLWPNKRNKNDGGLWGYGEAREIDGWEVPPLCYLGFVRL